MLEMANSPPMECDENISESIEFIRRSASTLGWGDLSDEVIMDIGCGSGKTTLSLLDEFTKLKKVIAIDIDQARIDDAKSQHPHPQIEYHAADIEEKYSIASWEGQIPKVISIYCLNQCKDQKVALRNVYELLKPGGSAALLFSLYSSFYDWFKDIAENPKWLPYVKDHHQHIPESHAKKFNSSHYTELLEEVGFTVVSCEDIKRTFIYFDDDACRISSIAACPLSPYIPFNLRQEFADDVFETFVRINHRSDDGRPLVSYTNLVALIKKPTDCK